VETESLIEFFRYHLRPESKAFEALTLEGFYCVQSFILLSNELSKKLLRTDEMFQQDQFQKFTSYSNVTGGVYSSYSFNNQQTATSDPDNPQFHILVDPREIEGLEKLWKIAIDSNDKQVADRAANLLIKLFTSTSPDDEYKIPQYEDMFIGTCMQILKAEAAKNEEVKEADDKQKKGPLYLNRAILPPSHKKILKCLSMLRELIRNSETGGTNGLKPHVALFKGQYLHSI